MNKRQVAPEVNAATLAAMLAQEIGLPPGNMWEPGICRGILRDFNAGQPWRDIESSLRLSLGLSGAR